MADRNVVVTDGNSIHSQDKCYRTSIEVPETEDIDSLKSISTTKEVYNSDQKNKKSKKLKKSKEVKLNRKVDKIKRLVRSELKLWEWSKKDYHLSNFHLDPCKDKVIRIDYLKCSEEEFVNRFELPNLPCIIINCVKSWKAESDWNLQDLLSKYHSQYFKVGEDDDSHYVYLKLKHYIRYLNSSHQSVDDSPLYIFDSNFSTNTNFKHKSKSKPMKGSSKSELLSDFEVPKYFKVDLFALTGRSRPPFRWFVMGGERSGTYIHVDPLGTSAWNALVKGHKRWVLFPQSAPLDLVHPKLPLKNTEGADWFQIVYPKFNLPATVRSDISHQDFNNPTKDPSLGQVLGMVEVLQKPGEIIYVPGGWSHVVLNLDLTIAITQNFCTPHSIERVYLKTRFSRPKLAQKLRTQIQKLGATNNLLSPPYNLYNNQFYNGLVEKIDSLIYVPALYTSSSDGSSSSSSDSSDYSTD